MDVYRKATIPAIYTALDFVRADRGPRIIVDCAEDLEDLHRLQDVFKGNDCISSLERYQWTPTLFIKAVLPDNILDYDGTSDETIEWRCYYWKIYDALKIIDSSIEEPAEALPLTDAGIDRDWLETLASTESCIPSLQDTEENLGEGYNENRKLTRESTARIKEFEKPIIAGIKLIEAKKKRLKPLAKSRAAKQASNTRRISMSPSDRHKILQRDEYRCIFCGQGSSPTTSLEVHHIIPCSLIDKLQLNSELNTGLFNLCTTCFDCNRGRSDHLAAGDIAFYQEKFSDPKHPNHNVLPYLMKVSELQSF